MQKGNTIYQFLQKCLDNLRKDFSELRYIVHGLISSIFTEDYYIRACSVDNLMYVKEDLIIPQV